jgi:hypothetical protein
VVAYLAVVQLGEPGRVVAEALGVSRSTISALLDRGRAAAEEDGFSKGGPGSGAGESDNPRI